MTPSDMKELIEEVADYVGLAESNVRVELRADDLTDRQRAVLEALRDGLRLTLDYAAELVSIEEVADGSR